MTYLKNNGIKKCSVDNKTELFFVLNSLYGLKPETFADFSSLAIIVFQKKTGFF